MEDKAGEPVSTQASDGHETAAEPRSDVAAGERPQSTVDAAGESTTDPQGRPPDEEVGQSSSEAKEASSELKEDQAAPKPVESSADHSEEQPQAQQVDECEQDLVVRLPIELTLPRTSTLAAIREAVAARLREAELKLAGPEVDLLLLAGAGGQVSEDSEAQPLRLAAPGAVVSLVEDGNEAAEVAALGLCDGALLHPHSGQAVGAARFLASLSTSGPGGGNGVSSASSAAASAQRTVQSIRQLPPEVLRERYWKTRICTNFMQSRCVYGGRCIFAHGYHELRSRPQGLGAPTGGDPQSAVAVGSKASPSGGSGPRDIGGASRPGGDGVADTWSSPSASGHWWGSGSKDGGSGSSGNWWNGKPWPDDGSGGPGGDRKAWGTSMSSIAWTERDLDGELEAYMRRRDEGSDDDRAASDRAWHNRGWDEGWQDDRRRGSSTERARWRDDRGGSEWWSRERDRTGVAPARSPRGGRGPDVWLDKAFPSHHPPPIRRSPVRRHRPPDRRIYADDEAFRGAGRGASVPRRNIDDGGRLDYPGRGPQSHGRSPRHHGDPRGVEDDTVFGSGGADRRADSRHRGFREGFHDRSEDRRRRREADVDFLTAQHAHRGAREYDELPDMYLDRRVERSERGEGHGAGYDVQRSREGAPRDRRDEYRYHENLGAHGEPREGRRRCYDDMYEGHGELRDVRRRHREPHEERHDFFGERELRDERHNVFLERIGDEPRGSHDFRADRGGPQPRGERDFRGERDDRQPRGERDFRAEHGDRQPRGNYDFRMEHGDRQPRAEYDLRMDRGDRQPRGERHDFRRERGDLRDEGHVYSWQRDEGQPRGERPDFDGQFGEVAREPHGAGRGRRREPCDERHEFREERGDFPHEPRGERHEFTAERGHRQTRDERPDLPGDFAFEPFDKRHEFNRERGSMAREPRGEKNDFCEDLGILSHGQFDERHDRGALTHEARGDRHDIRGERGDRQPRGDRHDIRGERGDRQPRGDRHDIRGERGDRQLRGERHDIRGERGDRQPHGERHDIRGERGDRHHRGERDDFRVGECDSALHDRWASRSRHREQRGDRLPFEAEAERHRRSRDPFSGGRPIDSGVSPSRKRRRAEG